MCVFHLSKDLSYSIFENTSMIFIIIPMIFQNHRDDSYIWVENEYAGKRLFLGNLRGVKK